MRRRRLTHIGSLGDDFVRRIDPHGERHRTRVIALWPVVVGPKISSHTRGFGLRDGQLLVYVDSPVWANELSIMGEDLRTRLNQEAGEEAVRSIRFIVSKAASDGVSDEPPKQGPRTP